MEKLNTFRLYINNNIQNFEGVAINIQTKHVTHRQNAYTILKLINRITSDIRDDIAWLNINTKWKK